ncbi:MAG: hypothetical protein QOK36_932 [Gaiellales bacterium]|nr:hypothetical protein [Gaiellales bacterium]
MSESRTLESSLPGVIPHVGVATLVRADGTTQLTLCRALGRNRVAMVAKRDLPVGEEVHFEIDVEGGMVRGTGRVERMHAGTTIDGSAEPWVVVDIDEMERGSVPRLLRLIFRDSYLEYAASRPELQLPKPLTVDETRERLRTPPPWREKPKSPGEKPKPSRPRIGRYAEPDTSDRWRLR